MFQTTYDIKTFQKNLRPSNNDYITYYFNTIYQNLLMREETPNSDINEFNNRSAFINNNKLKSAEKGISFKIFCQFFDIQEFICERIFNYLDKSKTGKLTKNEFINGLYTIFFGNLIELYRFTFSLCDFNENNKIHLMNVKLILSYIPVKTSEEQFEYIKHIRTILNHYFSYLDKQYKDKNIGIEKEIDFELYQNNIEEYIEDEDENKNKKEDNFNNNGSFFLFISLISYIYQHHPFISENMNYCKFLKNKFLIKNIQNRYKLHSIEKVISNKFSTTITEKHNFRNPICETSNKNSERQINNIGEKEKDYLILPKINLFHTSKRSTTTKIKTSRGKREEKIRNKIKEEENKIIHLKNNIEYIQTYNNKNENLKDNKINHLLKSSQFPDNNTVKLGGTFKNRIKNKIDPGVSHISPTKQKNIKYILNYDSYNNDYEENFIKEENENNLNKNNDEYCDLIFKYCEEENSKIIKKYYACIKGKDILFFSSKLKNELLTIWNISSSIIKVGDKVDVSKYTFYPIRFTHYNGSFSLIYFEEQEKQKLFATKCEEIIKYLKIEDLYEIKDKIGQGHFGVVKKCIEKSTGKEYAVKIMNKTKIKEKDFQLVIKERNFMSLIKHPNIVSLVQDFEDETYLYFVMEYFKGGDLSKYLSNIDKKEKNLEKISAKIIKIIAQGVQYLNHFGIVHRDLKPENIIFEQENEIKSIKIIDLGVAITLPYGSQATDPIGTLDYIAPEIFLHKPYYHKVDVWSIGILLYYLSSGGALPFDDEKNDEHIIGKKIVFTHQEYPDKLFGDKSKSLICLIDKALEKSPEKRISINEFLKEEWLNKNSK